MRGHISYHLILLLMDMRVHAPSDNVLESIRNGMVSSAVLSGALVQIWDVGEHNGLSINFFKLKELILKPSELISRIVEGSHGLKVQVIANVGVQ